MKTKKTLKEKVAYFAYMDRLTRDTPESFIGFGYDIIKRAFLKDYNETCEVIKTSDTDEFECFITILRDFIKKFRKKEIFLLCVDRKAQVGNFYSYNFYDEVEWERLRMLKKSEEIDDFYDKRARDRLTLPENKIVTLSEQAVEFIKSYAIKELNLELPIDKAKFQKIYRYAWECCLNMVDDEMQLIQDDYPERARDLSSDKFLAEINLRFGNECEIDYDDLNRRLQ